MNMQSRFLPHGSARRPRASLGDISASAAASLLRPRGQAEHALLGALLKRASWRCDALGNQLLRATADWEQAHARLLDCRNLLAQESRNVLAASQTMKIDPCLQRLRLAWFCRTQQHAHAMARELDRCAAQLSKARADCLQQQQQFELLSTHAARLGSALQRQSSLQMAQQADDAWLMRHGQGGMTAMMPGHCGNPAAMAAPGTRP
ncbi:MAG: hypothetical protein ACRYGK_11510 [Janthinobacterium lividum]